MSTCPDCHRLTDDGHVCFNSQGVERIVCDVCLDLLYDEQGHPKPVGYAEHVRPEALAHMRADRTESPAQICRMWGDQPSLTRASVLSTPCGCRIIGNGSSAAPLAIAFCRGHRASVL